MGTGSAREPREWHFVSEANYTSCALRTKRESITLQGLFVQNVWLFLIGMQTTDSGQQVRVLRGAEGPKLGRQLSVGMFRVGRLTGD